MTFSPSDILRLVLQALANQESPSPEEVENTLDFWISKAAPHLVAERRGLLDQLLTAVIISVGKSETLVDNEEVERWLQPQKKEGWTHWPWLKLYLSAEVRRPLQVMKELEESTDEVLDLLGDPSREGVWDRRGLVVGHVQSGKTQHYTALMAKALDAGYKLIIVLSGIHENLRQQTQERIEEVIIGKDSRNNRGYFGIRAWVEQRRSRVRIPDDPTSPLPDISTMTSIAGDFGSAVNRHMGVVLGHGPVVLVAKKNASILKNILEWMKQSSNRAAVKTPVLVIDDEADHSSINTAATDAETDPTTINRLIRRILWRCDRVAFVGYTATPYANIFMDPAPVEKREDRDLECEGSDIFPKTFITTIKAPNNYIGPEEVFGRDADESIGISGSDPLPMHIPAEDAEDWIPARHKKTHLVSPDLPDSLKEALRAFLLTVAARMALGHTREHMSMLIHVSRFTDVQEKVALHVENELSSLIERLRHGDSASSDWAHLRQIWQKVFVEDFSSFQSHPSQQLVKPILPEWQSVRGLVFEAFDRIAFRNINSSTKANLDYAKAKNGLVVVAVGGDRLSRGLTLAGLSISYFQRGARAFDTLMQMGRWFGYRPGYAHLCRVYSPTSICDSFMGIALATEELRREFSRMCFLNRKPTEYGLCIREPRIDLLVTAMNKMRRGESVRVHFSESLVSALDIPFERVGPNFQSFEQLISSLEAAYGAAFCGKKMASGRPSSASHHRWDDVDARLVKEFLCGYRASMDLCFEGDPGQPSLISKFLDTMTSKNELRHWTVVVFGSASEQDLEAIPGKPYRVVGRRIDPSKSRRGGRMYSFKGIAMGLDEAIDLSEDQIQAAEAAKSGAGRDVSRAALYRARRSPDRGLLLLYPIQPTKLEGLPQPDRPVIGIAVSFPGSSKDLGEYYVCNPKKLVELYGAEFLQDIDRDEKEQAFEAAPPALEPGVAQ